MIRRLMASKSIFPPENVQGKTKDIEDMFVIKD